ncbi:hypothetical protein QW131_27570 [Roseibium salinum]|nr:hypothetical protein [Roseibium salinum]
MFAEKYRQAFAGLGLDLKPEHGMDLAPHAGILDRLAAPVALRDYYEICGLHEINRLRNRLLPPEALAIRDGRLVFLAEEQECAFWGAARSGGHGPAGLAGRRRCRRPEPSLVRRSALVE